MKNYIAFIVAALLIMGAAAREWTWTGFPAGISESEAEHLFAERLDKVPKSFGEWESEDLPKMDARERATAGITGELSRTYRNTRTNDSVYVSIVSGNHRNIAQHTPNQCYVAAGFKMLREPITYPVPVGSKTVEFSTADFRKEDPAGVQVKRIFWAWSSDGQWESPKWGRLAMAGKPALYKMYLTTDEYRTNRDVHESASLALMRDFLDALNGALFPPDAPAAESTTDGSTPDSSSKSTSPETAAAEAPAAQPDSAK